MPRRVPVTELQADTMTILNTIRTYASAQYQDLMPKLEKITDIPKVGETLRGYPALANEMLPMLLNRIALVSVRSMTFNNKFVRLKKGIIEFGELVEEVFVEMAKAREFNIEKAAQREFKRTLPNVQSQFHVINYRVDYPITIQNDDLMRAFNTPTGFYDLIAKIVDSLYKGATYDEYLLFKYLLIKGITHGKMKPIAVDMTNFNNAAIQFRGVSNLLEFPKTDYNVAGVHVDTQKSDLVIIQDAMFNAAFDVNTLAAAYNMDKTTFMGQLFLVDDWNTFDSDRFSVIMENSDMMEPITPAELEMMKQVISVAVDKEWFQVYDYLDKITEAFVSAGNYWNYDYHVQKAVDSSVFSNAVVFVTNDTLVNLPDSIPVEIISKTATKEATIFSVQPVLDTPSMIGIWNFIMTETMVENGVSCTPIGTITIPANVMGSFMPVMEYSGQKYQDTTAAIAASSNVGDKFNLTKWAG